MNIRETLTATLAAAIMSTAAISAHETLTQTAGAAASNTVTYRGCLNEGPGDRTFVMSKATEKGQKGKEKLSFKVVPATDKVSLDRFLSNEVEIVGTLDAKLGVFTATKVSWRADYCG